MPKKTLTAIPVGRATVNDGFFSPVQKTVIHEMIPYQERALRDQIPGVKKSHGIENFRIAAGESEEEFYGYVFQDSDLAKWIEAVAYALTVEPDPELEARADEAIELIGRAQQPDGYLNTHFIVAEPERKWQNLADCHELYCAGHMTEAAVAYYEATGKDRLLNICRKLCDLIDSRFGEGPGKVAGIPGHEEIELALLRLYRVTGEERYRKLSTYFIDERGRDPEFFVKEAKNRGWGWMEVDPVYMQGHKPVREQETVEGHAVRCMYLLTAMADLAGLNGDEGLMAACRRLWDNMTEKRMYLTGGIGSSAHWEGFTADYDLPNDTAYAETCAAVGVCFFARRMLEAEPDARYADVMERALYNGAISGMQLDGTRFFYTNPLEANTGVMRDGVEKTCERVGWYDCACCPPNLARLITSLSSYVWASNGDCVYSHLFIGGTASFDTAGGVKVTLESRYPWDGGLCYTVEPVRQGVEFTLAIRRPGWCREARVEVNGEPVPAPCLGKDGYYHIKRQWRSGDKVGYFMELEARRIYANPKVRADAGCVAFMRGPLVYAFEGVDNGDCLQALRVPRGSVPEPLPFDPELLGGIVALRVPGLRKIPAGTLYTDHPPEEEPVELKAIPYYAWCNRGRTQMRVWMLE